MRGSALSLTYGHPPAGLLCWLAGWIVGVESDLGLLEGRISASQPYRSRSLDSVRVVGSAIQQYAFQPAATKKQSIQSGGLLRARSVW